MRNKVDPTFQMLEMNWEKIAQNRVKTTIPNRTRSHMHIRQYLAGLYVSLSRYLCYSGEIGMSLWQILSTELGGD
jgi:hypothetical protein